MKIKSAKYIQLLAIMILVSCGVKKNDSETRNAQTEITNNKQIISCGADQLNEFIVDLQDKKIGVVTNQTGMVGGTHLVDLLLENNIEIIKIFAPEHGFRGIADAGEHVQNGVDLKTKLPIISLYGDNKKPKPSQIADLDVIVFDIQDVGVRFYTYISTLHYIMEAAAENDKKVIVLDRPNPNGHYVDGPVLEKEYTSFVGMHTVPVVYGMTIGEYALMINGEKWLNNNVVCDLKVVPLKNYTHQTAYSLPVKPSPNLPNDVAINLYPSLCFFEGTNVSVGRGTAMQFQIYGSPYYTKTEFTFTPMPNEGAKDPLYKGKTLYGVDLRTEKERLTQLNFDWLIDAHTKNTNQPFFNKDNFFEKLAGTAKLRQQIQKGLKMDEIRASWQDDLAKFKIIRAKYLMYDED